MNGAGPLLTNPTLLMRVLTTAIGNFLWFGF